ncbi:unnamed protein product [Heterobilharzia americana]|nr:unnamed protein product [Heterobilharzia americana]
MPRDSSVQTDSSLNQSTSGVNLIKLFIIVSLPIVEMIITIILMNVYSDLCQKLKEKKYISFILIAWSAASCLLFGLMRGLRARFPINHVFLLLNTQLMCYAFIPPVLRIRLEFILTSFLIATVFILIMIIIGLNIQIKFFRVWLFVVICSWFGVFFIICICLYFYNFCKILCPLLIVGYLPFIVPILLRIGQLLRPDYTERMFDSHYMLASLTISIIFFFTFYLTVVQFSHCILFKCNETSVNQTCAHYSENVSLSNKLSLPNHSA